MNLDPKTITSDNFLFAMVEFVCTLTEDGVSKWSPNYTLDTFDGTQIFTITSLILDLNDRECPSRIRVHVHEPALNGKSTEGEWTRPNGIAGFSAKNGLFKLITAVAIKFDRPVPVTLHENIQLHMVDQSDKKFTLGPGESAIITAVVKKQ